MFLLLVLAALLTGCRHSESSTQPATLPYEPAVAVETGGTLRKVRVLPYWVPTAQFAGYYVGLERGIYRKHGIDLEMLDYDPDSLPEEIIGKKKADFAVLWLVNAMDIRGKDIPLVNIAQMSSRSSLMLISKKSSRISRLEDMNGKKAGIWVGYDLQPRALFKKYNLNVQIVPIGSTNNLFLQGGVDILNANWFDEYHSIINSGINEDELDRFFFADYGLNFLEDGLYCLSQLAETETELCARFVAATLESWQYAFDNQEQAVYYVIQYAKARNQPVNRSHQNWMLKHYQELYIPEGQRSINTRLRQEDYESIQQILLENDFIERSVPYTAFYRPVRGTS